MKWTEKQQEVISRRNRNILVSAAAGSGKTAVLVERIIQRILDAEHKVDIDRILVVTFTKAAASEMRERIADAIEKKLEEEPENTHLLRQSSLIHNARITTIHSFCQSVIRNYFYKIDLEPSFRIGDEGEIELLKSDVLDQLLEEKYEEADEKFLEFAEKFSSDKKDDPLKEQILQVYEYARSEPWPEKWLAHALEQYRLSSVEEIADKDWMKEVAKVISAQISGLEKLYEEALLLCESPGGPVSYLATLMEEQAALKDLSECSDFSQLKQKMGFEFGKLPRKNKDADEDLTKKTKEIRDSVKKQYNALKEKWFSQSDEDLLFHMQGAEKSAQQLVHIVLEFMEAYEAEKRERAVLDFSDLEHNALKILVDEESGEATDVAEEYRRFYEEIMIDEYQDSNYVQELILSTISRGKESIPNMFMVGDVKQSIYGFRLARPDLFMEKYHSYQTNGERNCKIELSQNFRSRTCVLDSINEIFFKLMKEDLGGIEYDADNALYPGNLYPNEDELINKTQILLTDKETGAEAALVAKEIRKLTDSANPMQVFDKKTGQMREIRYGDIVIIMRSIKGSADQMTRMLKDVGIPAISQSQTGYFTATEIRQLLAYLKIIDNPRQDIPLAAVLKSPIYSFTGEMLSKIRSIHMEGDYYDALQKYAEEGVDLDLREKCQSFLKELSYFRQQSRSLQMHELLALVLKITSFDKIVAAMPAGSQRLANIRMLYEKAIAFENTSYRGLFQFNRYIEQLQSYEIDYGEAVDAEESENAVRIYSIHKSKGLEFPVVFLCGCGKGFNKMDLRNKILLHGRYGFGIDDISIEKRSRYKTCLKNAIQLQNEIETIAEEMRVLYVAMTRAREKLYVLASVNEPDKLLEMAEEKNSSISFYRRLHAGSYIEWIMSCIGGRPDLYEISYISLAELAEETAETHFSVKEMEKKLEDMPELFEESDYKELEERFQREERLEDARIIPAKLSVSELKLDKIREQDEDIWEAFEGKKSLYVPDFARREEKENRGAAYGTAMHRFLECLPFTEISEEEDLLTEKDKLLASGKISQEEAELVSLKGLKAFITSTLFARMKRSDEKGSLKKEQPFVMSMKAREADPAYDSDAPLLIQGIMDAYFEEEGKIILVDYKTDKVSSGQELLHRYQRQMELYAHALNTSGKKVKEAVLYSFSLQEEIRVSLDENI
jgi:ATP-dependent helicase/nuclease subunit A